MTDFLCGPETLLLCEELEKGHEELVGVYNRDVGYERPNLPRLFS